jgi:RNA polymerase sigma-70 factor (ECF subfamily)
VPASRHPRPDQLGREDECSLIARAVRRDSAAARLLVEQHNGGLYARALRMTGDPVEAEDLVQEAFARAFCRLDQFDAQYRLSTWLHRILLNSWRDQLKSPRRRERPSDAPPEPAHESHSPSSDDPMLEREREQRLRSALDALRPTYREIIVLKDLLELSFEEIHELTGAPITGLKIRAIRARARLRALLAPLV